MKKLLLATFSTIAVVGSALSASADHQSPSGSASAFGGLYIGASVGYGSANTDFTHTFDNGIVQNITRSDISSDGATGTISLGYDVGLQSNIVAGIFADYTFGELDGSGVYALNVVGVPFNLSYDDTWAIGGRVGVAMSSSTLWYVTAGYTQTEFTLSDQFGTIEKDLDGYFLGAGVEQSLRHNGLFLKLEYRYSDFGSDRIFEQTAGCCSESYDIDSEIHSIRAGLTYKFGRREEEPAPLK